MGVHSILITGGTGAIGSVLVKKLAESGNTIRVLTLPNDPLVSRLDGLSVDIRYGDISNKQELKGICEGIDTVIHCAAVIIADDSTIFDKINIKGTGNILSEAALSDVKHFIHISSASVVYRKVTPYSLSKRVAERLVKDSNVPWTIVRPTLVYGKVGGQEFDMFLDYLNKFPIIPFIGDGLAIKRPVFVDDLIDGFVKLANIKEGTHKIYNFSGANSISMIDFARYCLMLMGENGIILKLPVWFCIVLAYLMKKTMKKPPLRWNMIAGVIQDADLDPSDAVGDLGYNPSVLYEKLPACFPRLKPGSAPG